MDRDWPIALLDLFALSCSLQVTCYAQTSTLTGLTGMLTLRDSTHASPNLNTHIFLYILELQYLEPFLWSFVARTRGSLASLCVIFTSLDHCIDTLSDYGPGRESCTDKTFCPRHGVLSGFVFNAVHRGDTTLIDSRQPNTSP